MSEASAVEAIVKWSKNRHLPGPHLERWLKMEPADGAALWELAAELKLRTGQLMTALQVLEELKLREKQSVRSILATPELRRAIQAKGSRPQRAAAFLDALRALRRPRLTRLRQSLSAEIAKLGLPSGTSVLLPKDLGSDVLTIEIRVRDGADLERILKSLQRDSEKLGRIIAALGGEYEL